MDYLGHKDQQVNHPSSINPFLNAKVLIDGIRAPPSEVLPLVHEAKVLLVLRLDDLRGCCLAGHLSCQFELQFI